MTSDRLAHYIMWHCSLLASSAFASFIELENDRRLQGLAVLPLGGQPCHIDYNVVVDSDWMSRSCNVSVHLPMQVRTIELRSDRLGHWEVNGKAAPHLDDCSDVDLGWTPATNTFPLRRLDLEVGDSANIGAAWVRFPELDVVASDQHYTRLAPDRWRYRSGEYDFELMTEAASGLVLAYPDDLWEAAATRLSLHEP